MKNNFSESRIKRYIAGFLILIVFAGVAVSQIYMALMRNVISVSSESGLMDGEYVSLNFETIPDEGAEILCNGKKFEFSGDKEVVIPIKNSTVIEVYNSSDIPMKLKIGTSSPGITVKSEADAYMCKKGLNTICRCIYTD